MSLKGFPFGKGCKAYKRLKVEGGGLVVPGL